MDDYLKFLNELIEREQNEIPKGVVWAIRPHPEILELFHEAGWSETAIQEVFMGEGPGWEKWLELFKDEG